MKIKIENETGKLMAVVVGIADNFGPTPKIEECYDPKSKEHIIAGTYPIEADCIDEMNVFVAIFKKYGIKVFRPENIDGLNQIFTRDIAFVVDDKLVISNIIEERKKEIKALADVLCQIPKKDIIYERQDF